jgi:hypothetical protein
MGIEAAAVPHVHNALVVFQEERLARNIEDVFPRIAVDDDMLGQSRAHARIGRIQRDYNFELAARLGPTPEVTSITAGNGFHLSTEFRAWKGIEFEINRLPLFYAVALELPYRCGEFESVGIDHLADRPSGLDLIAFPEFWNRHSRKKEISVISFNRNQAIHWRNHPHLLDVAVRLIHCEF